MSKLVLVSYRVSDAEARAVQRKLELLRKQLRRCVELQAALRLLEPIDGEDFATTEARYLAWEASGNAEAANDEYNRLYDLLPGIERELGERLATARAKRLSLQMTAATLEAGETDAARRSHLQTITANAATLDPKTYEQAYKLIGMLIETRLRSPVDAEPDETASLKTTADQVALAKELLDATPHTTNESLIPSRPTKPEEDAERQRIEKLVTQLSRLDPRAVGTGALMERLKALPQVDARKRVLLIDSITLEAAELHRKVHESREQQSLLDEALADLTPFTADVADHYREQLASLADADITTVRQVAGNVMEWAKAEGKRRDGARVRAAMIEELRDLGYEVDVQGEGWEEGREIAVRKPNEPNYDVQLKAPPGGSIQSKVRAYKHAGRGDGVNRRDVEVEQSWCSDLAKVNRQLAERGFAAEVLREDKPGSAAQVPIERLGRERPDGPGTGAQQPLERKA